MTLEKDFQKKFLSDLRKLGYKCFKQQMNATTRAGTPDCIICYKKFYGFCEFKKSKDAPFRPGQKETLEELGKWTYARVVFPENFDIIMSELIEVKKNEDMQN